MMTKLKVVRVGQRVMIRQSSGDCIALVSSVHPDGTLKSFIRLTVKSGGGR